MIIAQPISFLDAIRSRLDKYGKILLLLFLLAILIKSAWLCDDAYISFRTIDNFINGYGLRWNVEERVQSYTHPLWLIVNTIIYFFTKEIYLSNIILSLILSSSAVLLFLESNGRFLRNFVLVSLLICSKAFVDYSTSGLENPLSYLLLGIFLRLSFVRINTLKLFFLSSLLFVNRIDLLLFSLPLLVYILIRDLSKIQNAYIAYFGKLFLSISPAFCWLIFSTIYYGTPFPNTAFAKLYSLDISSSVKFSMGIEYLRVSFLNDPASALFCILGLATFFIAVLKKYTIEALILLGSFIYIFYVTIVVGGDFMSGRFLSCPIFVFIVTSLRIYNKAGYSEKALSVFTILILLFSLVFDPYSPLTTDSNYGEEDVKGQQMFTENGVIDERAFYYKYTGLLPRLKKYGINLTKKPIQAYSSKIGLRHRRAHKKTEKRLGKHQIYFVEQVIGLLGFYSGPGIHIVDNVGLADPLLSRIKIAPKNFRIGHITKEIPTAYIESLKSKENLLENTQLAEFYEKILILTRGSIWSLERFQVIWELNTFNRVVSPEL